MGEIVKICCRPEEALDFSSMFEHAYRGTRVLITGHTGFKGSWLALWLRRLGAYVVGYSLDPPSRPNHHDLLKLDLTSIRGDVRDRETLFHCFSKYEPEIVFHLAAQSLVRCSLVDPVYTFETNVMGTVNVLEACRVTDSVKAVVIVTSDKCYENKEWIWAYRENDPLGGSDPYSTSKACAELVAVSYRGLLLRESLGVATARAGNVIGGGDWAADRIIPDAVRAVSGNTEMRVRCPDAVRPWQHVLEPLYGYLLLGYKLFKERGRYGGAWNFGPDQDEVRSVRWVLEYLRGRFENLRWKTSRAVKRHEATLLRIDSSKARMMLGWQPLWNLKEALDRTAEWYKCYLMGGDIRSLSERQIAEYEDGVIMRWKSSK